MMIDLRKEARGRECQIRKNMGLGQRNKHKNAIPICFNHHSAQGSDGFHGGKWTWQAAHGTETELLEDTKQRLEGKI